MSHPDLVAANPAEFHAGGEDQLPDDPFTSLNYHFGMLLGVDDFETEQAYHRGKQRLHQGWLHGAGVVWGLELGLDLARGEVRVGPGLALDGAGRELHLDAAACLDPAAWLEEHRSEVTFSQSPPRGAELAFDAHVVMRFASCLTRSVPALAEPCEGTRVESAYSRVWETIDLELVPGLAPTPAERYRRVRILLGLLAPRGADPGDQQAAAAREQVLAADPAAPADRAAAALAAFRAMANADAAELSPGGGACGPRALTPDGPSTAVILGDIRGLALKRQGGRLVLARGVIDVAPRRSHIQTATIQELSAAVFANAAVAPTPGPLYTPLGVGVYVTAVTLSTAPGSRSRKQTQVVLSLSGPLDKRSVRPEAFDVTNLTDDGWLEVSLKTPPTYDDATTPPTVTLALAAQPTPPWQVIARATGPRPIVDPTAQPLGGGQDFVHMQGPEQPPRPPLPGPLPHPPPPLPGPLPHPPPPLPGPLPHPPPPLPGPLPHPPPPLPGPLPHPPPPLPGPLPHPPPPLPAPPPPPLPPRPPLPGPLPQPPPQPPSPPQPPPPSSPPTTSEN